MKQEMQKFLTSCHTFIESRSAKILTFSSYLTTLSIPCYTMVHTTNENNIGVLFQLLPKIDYPNISIEKYQSIVMLDEYAQHTISPEELRFIDYSLNVKHRYAKRVTQQPVEAKSNSARFSIFGLSNGTVNPNALVVKVYHSLSIIYPYDDNMVYTGKYPLFWTSNLHANENSEALFQTVSVEKNTEEYRFVQRLFTKTVSEQEITIAFIERIENPHLWEKFSAHRSYMRRKNGLLNLNERWLFHGTKSDNHQHIMSHGFNRSYCRDYVLYGRGVYFSRHACYSANYSDRKDLSSLFLCRVLVGNHSHGTADIRVPPSILLPNGKSMQADSTTDNKKPYSIVCTFHDDQNYPEYVITYMRKTN